LSTVINKLTSNSGSIKNYLNGVLLTNNVNILDLGITISADLSYNAHINNIVARALQRSSTSFRGFASRNLQLMRKAFVTLDLYLSKIVSCGVQTQFISYLI